MSKFEAKKQYRLDYPDGRKLTVELVGGKENLFKVKEGNSLMSYEELKKGNPTVTEVADMMPEVEGGAE